MLLQEGQTHLMSAWAPYGTNDNAKRSFARQALQLDNNYPGGLREYIRKGKELLQAA